MPKGMGYGTGGVHEGKGIAHYSKGDGTSVDVTSSGAGMGTGYDNPNNDGTHGAGGYGSAGTKSKSTPTGMKSKKY